MRKKLILIGASTGGPGHLKKIFSTLDSSFSVPIVVAQHMNPVFIKSFVKQFNDELTNRVVMADSRHIVEDYHIYICAKHCELLKKDSNLKLEVCEGVNSHYNPSVEHLFASASCIVGEYEILAILLTGIGSDGAKALAELQRLGARCIAESKESAIVYGMPKVAAELNSDIKVLSLDRIIDKIKQFGGV